MARSEAVATDDRPTRAALRVVEVFCGIGGCAAALGDRAQVVAAIDQNRQALAVYARNFPHPTFPLAVESIPEARWRAWQADLWWLSPPCRPFTTRGHRRDLDDPRARGLVAVIERLAQVRPRFVALENVPGFAGSRAHQLMRTVLEDAGYEVRDTHLCPTSLGMPNRRERFYLVAGREPLEPWPVRGGPRVPLTAVRDPSPDPLLWCEDDLAEKYEGALDIVDIDDPDACTACVTSAYGRSVVRSGSYVRTPSGLRRLSPAEVLRLLDFPAAFELPEGLPHAVAWPLVGNSVSVRAVRWVLAAVPGLGVEHAS